MTDIADTASEYQMIRAKRQCATCPFRFDMTEAEWRECVAVSPEHWSCHSANHGMPSEVQCRGHWEARKRFVREHGEEALRQYQEDWERRVLGRGKKQEGPGDG